MTTCRSENDVDRTSGNPKGPALLRISIWGTGTASLVLWLVVGLRCGGAELCAQSRGFGLGVIVGEPTGISGKLWLGERTAADGAVAWSVGRKDAVQVHGDFLVHAFDLIHVERGRLPFYYGIGGRLKASGESHLGVRIPVGVNYHPSATPIDVFLEIVPIMDLTPRTAWDVNAAIGARYFF
jgi:hypothetical protein